MKKNLLLKQQKSLSKTFVFLLVLGMLSLDACKFLPPPRCPIASCQVKGRHYHRQYGENLFRGSPWYKKQYPGYGEKQRRGVDRRKNQNFFQRLFGNKKDKAR